MAFRISKNDRQEIDAILRELDNAKAKLESAVDEFNNEMEQRFQNVADAIETYNSFRASLVEKLELLADDFQMEFDDKSEKWIESERGQAVNEWIEALRNMENEIEEVSIDAPYPIEVNASDSGDIVIEDAPEG